MIPITYKLDWYFPICHWNFVFFQSLFFCLFYNDFSSDSLWSFHLMWADFLNLSKFFQILEYLFDLFDTIIKSRALNKLYQLAGPWFGNSVYLDGGNCWNICLPHTAFFTGFWILLCIYIFIYESKLDDMNITEAVNI